MEETLILFETAKLAKEKGFDWIDKDKPYYSNDHNILGELKKVGIKLLTSWINSYKSNKADTRYNYISLRPTQSLLQKWLREVHNIEVYVRPFINAENHEKHYRCFVVWFDGRMYQDGMFFTGSKWEEALEVGLQEGLKLIELSK